MKKYIIILISLFACINLWCTWEGNGLAGAATDFTEDGMFVKSSLLPKYSLVEVTNLENDIKVRAIVLDGKDVPGILMSFSPSVAEALKVSYGAVARIRVASPNVVDEGDSFAKEEIPPVTSAEVALKEEVAEKSVVEANIALQEEVPLTTEKEDSEDVILYDFKPIAKTVEKKGKDEGAISFDPAFIEEEVTLNIHIPENPIKREKNEVLSTEKVVSEKVDNTKSPVIVARVAETGEEKKEVEKVIPPKIVKGTEKREVFLEKTALRPPKEVPVPSVKENVISEAVIKVEDAPIIKKWERKEGNTVEVHDDVKNVLVPEKKEEKQREVILIVPEVKDVEQPIEKKEEEEVVVDEVKTIVPKVAENEKNKVIEAVSHAPIILEKEEEKKLSVEKVQEIIIPKAPEKENDATILPVKEVKSTAEIRGKNESEETVVENNVPHVMEVDGPKKMDSANSVEIAKVPVVEAIKEVKKDPINAKPIEQPLYEKNSLNADVAEEPLIEEKIVEEEVPVEEEVVEEEAPVEEKVVEEEAPVEEKVAEEEAPVEKEVVEEEAPVEEKVIEEKLPVEEEIKFVKVLNEQPLREIEVHGLVGRLNEEPSREQLRLPQEKEMVAIDNYDVLLTKEGEVRDVSERALDEVSVEKTKETDVKDVSAKALDEVSVEKAKEVDVKDVSEKALDEVLVEKTKEADAKDVNEKALDEVSLENEKIVQNTKNEYDEIEAVQEKPIKEVVQREGQTVEIRGETVEKKEEVKKEEVRKENPQKEEIIEKKEELDKKEPEKEIQKKEEVKKEQLNKVEPIVKDVKQKEALKAERSENFPIGKIVKGYSYVQIGAFGNVQRVEELLRKYGSSYPIVVEKRVNASKAIYVVFVGPLQKDEVGAVQESFRSFGFKDAF